MRPLRGSSRQALAHPPLLALETEYAATFFTRDGSTRDRLDCTARAVRALGARCVNLRGRDAQDLFLINGSRVYRDAGFGLCNLEYATPECSSPDELIAHVRAGDAIAEGAVSAFVASQHETERAMISKTNVDYQGTTNGSHENYLHDRAPAVLARHLIPLLVSRVVVSGSGGFDDSSPGVDFMCSPRVTHLEHVISRGAQHDRAIFTIKDEDLSGSRYRRLHLLCSDGVRCETTERLRFAMVTLCLRLLEAGARPGIAMRLANPLAAINTFARDPSAAVRVPLTTGNEVTALDIQHHYLEAIEARLGESWMPAWAETACAQWRAVLTDLATAPGRLIGRLDWPTKQYLFRAHCHRRAIPWDTLPRWGLALRALQPPTASRARTPDLQPLLECRGHARSKLAQTLEQHDLDIAELPRFVTLRDELFELDVRFGELGSGSLFAALEHSQLIARGTVTPKCVEAAMAHPPKGYRAERRAAWIRHLHASRLLHSCDWHCIHSLDTNVQVDLSDPFQGVRPGEFATAEPQATRGAHPNLGVSASPDVRNGEEP